MKLAIIEGDGIGKEVITSAVEVLDALGLEIEKVPLELGYGKWDRTGTAITDEDIDILKECDCVLFGAVTTPPDPNYKSVLLTIRKELDVYANIRPIKPLAGIKGATGRNDFDFVRTSARHSNVIYHMTTFRDFHRGDNNTGWRIYGD